MAENVIEKPDRTPIRLTLSGVRCGSCIFLKHTHMPGATTPCKDVGWKEYSKPCHAFTANPYDFDMKTKDREARIRNDLKNFSIKRLQVLTALFNQEIGTRRRGFHHGQTAYVKLFGNEYLSNYAEVKIISATRTHVYVQGDCEIFKGRGSFLLASVLNEEAFAAKKKSLERRKKLTDPKLRSYFIPKSTGAQKKKPAKTEVGIVQVRGGKSKTSKKAT